MTLTTRFAPSPTGMLHIGGARTALFNYLFARAHKGLFLLRIEDTDAARSTSQAVTAIFDGLDWLGLAPDAPAVFQSHMRHLHLETAQRMLDEKTAFQCWLSDEECEHERKRCHAEGRAFRSIWRSGTSSSTAQQHARPVLRLRAPDRGLVTINDAVRGHVTVKAADIDDMVLVRADGAPTYMLAVVVDDHQAGVTHVIRGEDHLTNAVRQSCILKALKWPVPIYAHLPLIHGSDGRKLSKRHGALGVAAYRDMGYLPEGLNNYLLRLGFSHGDKEIFTRQEAIDCFDLARIHASPARMDRDKLDHINGYHLRAHPLTDLLDALDMPSESVVRSRIAAALPKLKQSAATLQDLRDKTAFLTDIRPVTLDEKQRARLPEETMALLTILLRQIRNIDSWTESNIASTLKRACADMQVTMGDIGPALRLCLTGGRPAPGLASVIFWLGSDETALRVGDQAPGAHGG